MRALPVRSRSVRGRWRSRAGAALLGIALLGPAGCSSTDGDSGTVAAPPPPPPPPPPAACLLDLDALARTTGLTWTPDATTASDVRCVYDPGPAAPAAGPTATAANGAGVEGQPAPTDGAGAGEFVAVDITRADERPIAAQLDAVAEVCDPGSRAPVGTGFVCRFDGGSVYAGLVRGDDVVTVAASAVPPGTTAAALTMAIGQQVDALS